jgi:P pilus assembly chaperone PapD
MLISKKLIGQWALALSALAVTSYSFAGGMQPATSVVLVSEGQGEHSMSVKNTDSTAALLYTSLENIEEDKEKLLIVTPPVTRVEGGETQLVRFILQSKEPLKTQRLMRVYFEGIPLSKTKVPNSVGVTIRQNLPVIISPKGLAPESEPWKHLKVAICDGQLQVTNDSPYVVRLAQQGTLQPSGSPFSLPKSYVLPQTKLNLKLEASSNATMARIHPASVYGYAVKHYDAPLVACTR